MNILARLRHLLGQAWLSMRDRSSAEYWEARYRLGMNSGVGSTGEFAEFKARVINDFVREHGIQSVIEFGCGDGMQLALARYPRYLGIDVSKSAIELCQRRFAGDSSKSFQWRDPADLGAMYLPAADLTLSLDVIYHLVEDEAYNRHLNDLFSASRSHVIVYSSNGSYARSAAHVRHREFVRDVAGAFPAFSLVRKIDNPRPNRSFADFYFFSRAGS